MYGHLPAVVSISFWDLQDLMVLADAPRNPEAKNKILDSMHIIGIPLCAMFLGVPEADMYWFGNANDHPHGGQYKGAWCYSLNELLLFALHPEWFMQFHNQPRVHTIDSARTVLYFGARVGIEIAAAYLNDWSRSHHNLPVHGLRRCYRVSDMQQLLAAKCAEIAND
jgi:hypothetical protein